MFLRLRGRRHDMATDEQHLRVAILGAGFAGLGTAIRLKQ
jgi:cation diffusion facilitator CzcD-associated flavoprotein CzcO